MKALEFIKESAPINVEEIQRKQHLHNIIENAWKQKMWNEAAKSLNNYINK